VYPVSDKFLRAIQENSRSYYWSGELLLSTGETVEFTHNDIVKGSGYITNQCTGGSEIGIGDVYAAELGISLYTREDILSLKGGQIKLFFHLKVAEDSYETVPMGVFDIEEVNRTLRCTELKAYDFMLRFDKTFKGTTTNGTLGELLALACKSCGVEMAQTVEELSEWPNGDTIFSIYPENDIETWRDLIYYVAQVFGGFATINRFGQLEIRKYKKTVDVIISARHRFSSSLSEYRTRYSAVRITNMNTQESEYYALDEDDGLTLSLESNPLLQYGVQSLREQVLYNILNEIAVIDYVPCEITYIGNPAVDLGDVILNTGGQAGDGCVSAVTAVTYYVNGKDRLQCVGKNPALASAKSKGDKNIAGLMKQIESGKMIADTYLNAATYVVGDAMTEIIAMDILCVETTSVQFLALVSMEVSSNAVSEPGTVSVVVNGTEAAGTCTMQRDGMTTVSIVYELNGNVIATHQPAGSWHSGKQMFTLFYPIEELIGNTNNEWKVYVKAENGTVTVQPGGIIASVYGQGIALSEEAEWDGYIRVEERIGCFDMGMQMARVSGDVISHLQVEQIHSVTDDIAVSHLGIEPVSVLAEVTGKRIEPEKIQGATDVIRVFGMGLSLTGLTEAVSVGTEEGED